MASSHNIIEQSAEWEYNRALRKAFWLGLVHRVGKRCNDLVPVANLFEPLEVIQQHDLGKQKVRLDRIVGSGRAQDFDLAFNPKRLTLAALAEGDTVIRVWDIDLQTLS